MEGNIIFFPTSLILLMPTDCEEYLFEFNNWASNTLFFNLNRNVFIERNTTVYNFWESYLYQKLSPLRCQFYFLGCFFLFTGSAYIDRLAIWRHLTPKVEMWTLFQPQSLQRKQNLILLNVEHSSSIWFQYTGWVMH